MAGAAAASEPASAACANLVPGVARRLRARVLPPASMPRRGHELCRVRASPCGDQAAESPWATSVSPVQVTTAGELRDRKRSPGAPVRVAPQHLNYDVSSRALAGGNWGAVPDVELTSFTFEKTSRTGSPLTESNRRPSPYHGDALPTELRGRVFSCLTWASAPPGALLRCTPVLRGHPLRAVESLPYFPRPGVFTSRHRTLSPRTICADTEDGLCSPRSWVTRGCHGLRRTHREHVEAFIVTKLERTVPAFDGLPLMQQLLRWLDHEGELDASPMATMQPPKIPEAPVPVL